MVGRSEEFSLPSESLQSKRGQGGYHDSLGPPQAKLHPIGITVIAGTTSPVWVPERTLVKQKFSSGVLTNRDSNYRIKGTLLSLFGTLIESSMLG